jgi:acyl carrier protein
MTQTALRDKIRQYILTEFLPGETAENLPDDTPLVGSGILDSMSTLKLVSYVEDTFGITVDAHEASSEFGTIADVAALVERKKS